MGDVKQFHRKTASIFRFFLVVDLSSLYRRNFFVAVSPHRSDLILIYPLVFLFFYIGRHSRDFICCFSVFRPAPAAKGSNFTSPDYVCMSLLYMPVLPCLATATDLPFCSYFD